eukprot:GHVN01071004.1.p1 GENE.GHVN01071004.1~~GHVN01071004.1.p1  ORF type:complete len:108 (+),score=20.56 GHVN01071004.1:48-371(+)
MNPIKIIAISALSLSLTSLASARESRHEQSVWRYERMPYGPPPPSTNTNPFYGIPDLYGNQASIIGAYQIRIPDSDPEDGQIFLFTIQKGGVVSITQVSQVGGVSVI